MSDPSTAAPEDSLTDEQGGEDTNPDPYTLQVFLLRGDPDSDPTEVAGDAWQFDASDDDEATIAALETLATEFGGEGEPNAAPPQQAPSQPGPSQGAPAPPGGPGPGQPPRPQPGGNVTPPGGPAQTQPGGQAPPPA